MEISDLINDYENINSVQMGDFYEITTPFLDINNDYIQIYVKISDDTLYFTDDGCTINTLLSCGLSLSKKHREILQKIVQQHGLSLEESFEITTKSSIHDFQNIKHLFIQCILKVIETLKY